MEVHNQKYVTLSAGHFRTFRVEYEDRGTKGRTRSFRTSEEANDFADSLSIDAFYRIQQIDYRTLRQSETG